MDWLGFSILCPLLFFMYKTRDKTKKTIDEIAEEEERADRVGRRNRAEQREILSKLQSLERKFYKD